MEYVSKYQTMITYILNCQCSGCAGTGFFKWQSMHNNPVIYTCSLCRGTGANNLKGNYMVETPYTALRVINTLLYILDEE